MIESDQLSWALCRILELEELLEESNDQIHRLIEGLSTEWEEAGDGSF
jgi:hypothetical protein